MQFKKYEVVLEKNISHFNRNDFEELTIEQFSKDENLTELEESEFTAELSKERLSVNIHRLVAHQTFFDCLDLIYDTQTDPRLSKLNAVVFLGLKPCGDRNKFTLLNKTSFSHLVKLALNKGVRIGFDSCSAHKFLEAVKGSVNYEAYVKMAEPCESYLFSFYVNVEGKTTPCSFLETKYEGLDVLNCEDFLRDIWFSKEAEEFRHKLLNNSRK